MATRKNGSGNLESVMAVLIQNQALFVNQMSSLATKGDERFARIEKDLDLIKALLIKHEDALQKLPEAIGENEKIGFKALIQSPDA